MIRSYGPIDWNTFAPGYTGPRLPNGAPEWTMMANFRSPIKNDPNNPPMWEGGTPNFNEGTGQRWGRPTPDWKFGRGQGYRPGRDPEMDQRMWNPRRAAPPSFNRMVNPNRYTLPARYPEMDRRQYAGFEPWLGNPNYDWNQAQPNSPKMSPLAAVGFPGANGFPGATMSQGGLGSMFGNPAMSTQQPQMAPGQIGWAGDDSFIGGRSSPLKPVLGAAPQPINWSTVGRNNMMY